MKIGAMVTAFLLGAFAIGFSYPSSAQNSVGGATKTKQNAVGGAAKPGPVIGGATTPVPVAPKPGPVGGATKQGSVGSTLTPGSTGSTTTASSTSGNTAKPNPPVTPPNKGGTVVTTSSNLKCAKGACVAKGTKP